ncbi:MULTISPECIES: hypothetical protein [unclassified Halorubrum]|uniref:hypothetical protein n=1 Tax=unclassified Halorubrum TaxID=2642239 RepID=UPI0010F729E4|nr:MULTISPECIES: hypothetical protein [unclassified Halorubrum]TKX42335.1 hypothetical protein EXE50_14175 [Halorubrum sp. ARQ200]TKX50449.1 hypothetical protein EXE49_05075 [Halorubrum sp. ASP121]TKX62363.1 hypothetical protein EXE48_06760 [Halorubrum sp. ASP1]
MLDEIFDVFFGAVAELVPDVVWGALFLIAGALATMIGVSMLLGVTTLDGSVRLGGLLTAVGVSMVGGVLVAWYR